MSQFKFSLERVRQLRQRVEKEAALNLARAQQAEADAQAAHQSANAREADVAARLSGTPGRKVEVGALQPLVMLKTQLQQAAREAEQAHRAAHDKVAADTRVLGEAMQARRVLDRLRVKQHDAWKEGEARADMAAMDEVARVRASLDDSNRKG